jgi:hypothetical protein
MRSHEIGLGFAVHQHRAVNHGHISAAGQLHTPGEHVSRHFHDVAGPISGPFIDARVACGEYPDPGQHRVRRLAQTQRNRFFHD